MNCDLEDGLFRYKVKPIIKRFDLEFTYSSLLTCSDIHKAEKVCMAPYHEWNCINVANGGATLSTISSEIYIKKSKYDQIINVRDIKTRELETLPTRILGLWTEYKVPDKSLNRYVNVYSDKPYKIYQKITGNVIIEHCSIYKDRWAQFEN